MSSVGVLFACATCGMPAAGGLGDAGPDGGYAYCPDRTQTEWGVVSCGSCAAERPGRDDDGDEVSDLDGDCDDQDSFVGPGALETCDLRDNDCDGLVDEGVCLDPAEGCPISFAQVSCCGADHTLAGSFLGPDHGTVSVSGLGAPWVVLVRRADTGELRAATTCPAPAGFRFHLRDSTFVEPGVPYLLLVHLRWYFPWAADIHAGCFDRVPLVVPAGDRAVACLDLGQIQLSCL